MTLSRNLADRIDTVADVLAATDLRPGPVVDSAFSELVNLALECREPVAGEVLTLLGPRVESIRRLCAAGESELENAWADRIVDATDPVSELERFPYLGNYRDLVALEVGALHGLGVRPRTGVMLGSGPLPLTGLLMAAEHGMEVTLVDRDEECLERGERLVRALGVAGVTSVLADVEVGLPAEVAAADLVLQAALVGADDAAKGGVLAGLAAAMRPGAHLVVRSATALRELLYAPAVVHGVPGLTMLLEIHPHHDVVNSFLVARRDELPA